MPLFDDIRNKGDLLVVSIFAENHNVPLMLERAVLELLKREQLSADNVLRYR